MDPLSRFKLLLRNRWALLTVWSVFVLIVNIISFFLIDLDLGISFAQNITAEALGTVAGVLFIQRYVDMANQKEADQTQKIISHKFDQLEGLVVKKNNNSPQTVIRRQRYTTTNASPRKRNRSHIKRASHLQKRYYSG